MAIVKKGWSRHTVRRDALTLVPTHRVQSLAAAISLLCALALDRAWHHVCLSEVTNKLPIQVVNISMILLHLIEMVVPPPARYPDLFPVLNVLVSTPVFGLIWLWSIRRGIQVSWAIAGLPGSKTDGKVRLTKDGAQDSDHEHASETVRRSVGASRRDAGMRAMSLGYASGQSGVMGGRGYADPRRRALERLSRRAGSVEVEM